MALVSLLLVLCAAASAQSITNINYNTGAQNLSFTLNDVKPSKVEVLVGGKSAILAGVPTGTNNADMTILIPRPGGTVTVRLLAYPTDASGNIVPGPPVLADEESLDVSY
jgi:hypothetical protein